MTIEQHHLLCLGVLSGIYQKSREPAHKRTIFLPIETSRAIEEAVESAEEFGLPVSFERLLLGLPIATNQPEDSFP